MRLNYWLRSLFAVPPRRRTRTAASAVEALEDRTLLTTFTVGGGTSLQAALSSANAPPSHDTIILPAGTYTLSGSELQVTQHLDIIGDGADATTITANQQSRVLNVFPNVELNIQGVTLTNGKYTVCCNSGGTDKGGAVRNRGVLTLRDSAVTQSENGWSGGGISNHNELTLIRSVVSGNTVTGSGGGIWTSEGSVTHISDSLISTNTASQGGGGVTSYGFLQIERSTISDNIATGDHGGGIRFDGGATLHAVTISGNWSGSDGGGVSIGGNPLLDYEFVDSTIANNTARAAAAIHDDYTPNTIIQNTIIFGNTATDASPTYPIISGTVRSLGNNLLQDLGQSNSFTDGVNGDQVGVDPLLGSLQDNGGPTPTHALLPGSPAIDAGRAPNATATDQRGVVRPQDGNGDGTAAVDIGAYEWIENAPPTLDEIAVPEPITESSGQQTISLAGITGGIGESQAVQVTAASSNQAVILDPVVSYTSPDSTGTLTYTPAGLGISEVTVTVTDGGTDDDLGTTPDNATVTRTFTVDVRDSGILYVNSDDWSDDGLTVLLDGANVRVVVTGTDTNAVSPTALAGITEIDVSGRPDADDLLTVDYTGGNPAPSGGITFDGDTGSDALALENGSVTTTGYVFTDSSSGTIDVDGGVITYTNLEPITDNLSAVDRVFTFGPGSDEVTLVDISGISRLSSVSSSETVDFTAPTGSLTINTSAGNDTVDTSGSNLAVTLNGGAGFDWLTGGPSADRLLGGGRNDTLDGGAGNDTISGQAGFDWLYGGDDGDSLDGGDGDDTIDGEAGDDTILGGEGFDRLVGDTGNDQIDGGTEDDRIGGGDGDDILDGGDGDDFLNGQLGDDTLVGGIGDDRVFGGSGDDELDGGDDDDRIRGNGGNDVLTAGLGTNRLDGGSGTDRLTETAIRSNEDLVLFASMFRRSMSGGKTYDSPWQNIEEAHFVGNEGSNTLNVAFLPGSVTLEGASGNDFLISGSAADSLDGGDGNDSINGGDGDNTLDGGIGNDFLWAGEGDDSLIGSDGNDTINGGDGDDSLNGNSGDDSLSGGGDEDSLTGGVGNDFLDGGLGLSTIDGGEGDDTVKTGAEADSLVGGIGRDRLQRTNHHLNIILEDGLLTATGGTAGTVQISFDGFELVTLIGGPADQVIDASGFTLGSVRLYGSGGNDTLVGSKGDDVLSGGTGDNVLSGGEGDDLVVDTTGAEVVTLLDDALSSSGHNILSDIERAYLSTGYVSVRMDASGFTAGPVTLIGSWGRDTLIGTQHADRILGGSGRDSLFGGDGNDTILGENGKDSIWGGEGTDWIRGGEGNDNIQGENGSDDIDGGSGQDRIDGGPGNDVLRGSSENDTLKGGIGDDYIDAGSGNDTINGGGGNDTIKGGTGNDGLSGADGNDWLYGSSGNDTLIGRAGNDRLYGNAGDDIALGGDGDDRINCATGTDTVAGNAGTDVIKDDLSEIDESFTFWAAWVDDD